MGLHSSRENNDYRVSNVTMVRTTKYHEDVTQGNLSW